MKLAFTASRRVISAIHMSGTGNVVWLSTVVETMAVSKKRAAIKIFAAYPQQEQQSSNKCSIPTIFANRN